MTPEMQLAIDWLIKIAAGIAAVILSVNQGISAYAKIRAETEKTKAESGKVRAEEGDIRAVTLESLWRDFNDLRAELTDEREQLTYLQKRFDKSERRNAALESILRQHNIAVPADTEPLGPAPVRRNQQGLARR